MFCRCCLHHACIPNRREHVRLYLGQIPRVFVCHHPWPGPLLFVPRANASQARPLAGSWRQKTDSRLVRCQITIQSTLGRMKKHMPNSDTDTKTGRTLHHFFFFWGGGGDERLFHSRPFKSDPTRPSQNNPCPKVHPESHGHKRHAPRYQSMRARLRALDVDDPCSSHDGRFQKHKCHRASANV